MSALSDCCSSCCSTPAPVNVMGSQGVNGAAGDDGINAFTTLTTVLNIPAAVGPVNGIGLFDASWVAIGQVLFISDDTNMGTFTVTAVVGNVVDLQFLNAPDDTPGATIAIGGKVSPGGQPGVLATPVSIANGGTGSTSAPAALRALGATYRLLGILIGADFDSTGDQAITGLPTKWIPRRIVAQNASINLTTAAGGIYTGAAKTGTIIVAAAQVYTALSAASKFKDLTIDATAGGPTTDVLTATTVYFALTTAQGAAATGDIYIWGEDLS